LLDIVQTRASGTTKLAAPRQQDLRTSSSAADLIPKGVTFGAPSSSGTSNAKSGTNWGGLVSGFQSGGLAGAFGGGLSSITGLGGVISGILGLFGGGKTQLPPLVKFQLPNTQEENITITNGTAQAYSSGVQASTTSQIAKAPNPNASSQQIVQAVKEALLNSSSLNDVISEI
jgi:hypothetical protein